MWLNHLFSLPPLTSSFHQQMLQVSMSPSWSTAIAPFPPTALLPAHINIVRSTPSCQSLIPSPSSLTPNKTDKVLRYQANKRESSVLTQPCPPAVTRHICKRTQYRHKNLSRTLDQLHSLGSWIKPHQFWIKIFQKRFPLVQRRHINWWIFDSFCPEHRSYFLVGQVLWSFPEEYLSCYRCSNKKLLKFLWFQSQPELHH